MTETPIDGGAVTVALKAGCKYSFCSCGQSKTLPWCDDSHKAVNEREGAQYKPVKVRPEKNVVVRAFSKNWKKG